MAVAAAAPNMLRAGMRTRLSAKFRTTAASV